MKQCLMIKTKDQRHFFTHEEHLSQLIEFSKVFETEISIVKIDDDKKILNLEELPTAFCDGNYVDEPDYELIRIKIAEFKNIAPQSPHKRKNILALASQVKTFIMSQLLTNGLITFSQVEKKFNKHNLSKPTISNHIRRVKEELAQDGYKVIRKKRGVYIVE